LLGWDDLESLSDAGCEIGSHGADHVDLSRVEPQDAADEIEGAKAQLEERLGSAVPLFAYPYGAHNATVRDLARRAHSAACGTRLALASDADLEDGFRLPRIDAYYLRRIPPAAAISSRRGRAYLATRRLLRRLRHGAE
jgi:peptidoglycan/xylan/chitin deacetylase (PgdA/CDA1 family)